MYEQQGVADEGVGAKSTKRSIPSAMDQFDKDLALLSSSVFTLEERLSPVLVPLKTSVNAKESIDTPDKLASRISLNLERLRGIRNRVDEIGESLEL
jgi:hypothetical protein